MGIRARVLLLLALTACGGELQTVSDAAVDVTTASDGDGQLDAFADALDAGVDATCPEQPPLADASCPAIFLTCEYGDAVSPSCDAVFGCFPRDPCKAALSWQQLSPMTTCPTSSKWCPATFAGANNDASPDTLGAAWTDGGCGYPYPHCNYVEGWCECAPAPTGWYCVKAAAHCTANRPRIGSACSPETTDPNDECPFQLDPQFGNCFYGCHGGVITIDGCNDIGGGPPPIPCN